LVFIYIYSGGTGLGKTTFINTLFATLLKEPRSVDRNSSKNTERTVSIDIVRAGLPRLTLEIEEKGFNVRLTVIDTPGFGDYMNNSECWVPIVEFIDEQHSIAFKNERAAPLGPADDTRVHACCYFIQPTGHTLTPLDIKVMKELGKRVNLIPIIAKGDTISKADLAAFKERVSFGLT
jgi:cell division control protein 12